MEEAKNISSKLKNSFISFGTLAANAAISAANSIPLPSNGSLTSPKALFNINSGDNNKLDEETNNLLEGLGFNKPIKTLEKKLIFEDFQKISTDDLLTIEKFVIDMLQKGLNPVWADAAFRSVDYNKTGFINKFQYLLAYISLKVENEYMENITWIELRRKLVFSIYNRQETGSINCTEFGDLFESLSRSDNGPEYFGIINKRWKRNTENNCNKLESVFYEHDNEIISQELAQYKLKLAEKDHEHEILQLSYLKLEKQNCALKLELASLKSEMDS